MSILTRLRDQPTITRANDFGEHFYLPNGGPRIPITGLGSMPGSPIEETPSSYVDVVHKIGERSGPVAAAVTARSLVLSQLRFRWRPMSGSNKGLFGSRSLAPLENPGGSITRPELLTRIEHDVCWSGNAYIRRMPDGTLRRLRPDWVSIRIGSDERPEDVAKGADAEVIGYVYNPPRSQGGQRPQTFVPSEIAHFAPEPHTLSRFIGASWVTSVAREALTGIQGLDHVTKYFENAATANMVVTTPPEVREPDDFKEWVGEFENAHAGASNAWRNVYLSAGSDVKVVGANLGDLAMKELLGGFETAVSYRSRVPAPLLGIREGMQGSSLTAGNYGQVRRNWADNWFTPYAEALCASLERIVDKPGLGPVELAYDPELITMLQEDVKDAAEIRQANAVTLGELFRNGWDADAAVEYVRSSDLTVLTGNHAGLPSVQLQTDAARDDDD